MSWVRIDDAVIRHPKVLRAIARGGPEVLSLWLAILCHCASHNTHGHLDADMVAFMLPGLAVERAQQLVEILAAPDIVLLEPVEGGFFVHDWDHYQGPDAHAALEKRRAADRARAKRYRIKLQASAAGNAEGNASRDEKRDDDPKFAESNESLPQPGGNAGHDDGNAGNASGNAGNAEGNADPFEEGTDSRVGERYTEERRRALTRKRVRKYRKNKRRNAGSTPSVSRDASRDGNVIRHASDPIRSDPIRSEDLDRALHSSSRDAVVPLPKPLPLSPHELEQLDVAPLARAWLQDATAVGHQVGPPHTWGAVREVIATWNEFWHQHVDPQHSGDPRVRVIVDRLAENYTIEALGDAIRGALKDTWLGERPQQQSLKFVLRDGDAVDGFRRLLREPQRIASVKPTKAPIVQPSVESGYYDDLGYGDGKAEEQDDGDEDLEPLLKRLTM